MKILTRILLVVAAIAILIKCNRPTSEEQTSDPAEDVTEELVNGQAEEDAEFMIEAHTYSLMLRQYGKIAMEKQNIPPAVKEFAETSVKFNENVSSQLTQMTLDTKIILPSQLGENVLEYKERLKEKEGSEFAEDYMDVVGEIQSKMISEYQQAFNDTDNAQLKEWLTVVIPQINRREEEVDALAATTDELD